MRTMRMMLALVVALVTGSGVMAAQDASPAAGAVPAATARTVETPVDRLVRKDSYAVALTLPDKH